MISDRAVEPILTRGIMLACPAVIIATVGWQMLAGFVMGIVITFVAAALVNADFEI